MALAVWEKFLEGALLLGVARAADLPGRQEAGRGSGGKPSVGSELPAVISAALGAWEKLFGKPDSCPAGRSLAYWLGGLSGAAPPGVRCAACKSRGNKTLLLSTGLGVRVPDSPPPCLPPQS